MRPLLHTSRNRTANRTTQTLQRALHAHIHQAQQWRRLLRPQPPQSLLEQRSEVYNGERAQLVEGRGGAATPAVFDLSRAATGFVRGVSVLQTCVSRGSLQRVVRSEREVSRGGV